MLGGFPALQMHTDWVRDSLSLACVCVLVLQLLQDYMRSLGG
jgi:hypothetical protein